MRYLISVNGESYFPSAGVTTILDELNKPAIVGWAAKMTAKYVRSKAAPYIDIEGDAKGIQVIVPLSAIDEAPKKYNEARDAAKDDGTIVHDIASKYIKSKIDHTAAPDAKYSENVMNAMIAFFTIEKDFGIEWIESEVKVFYEDDEKIYAGTLDAIAKIQGKTYLIDLKTGSDFYPEMYLQTAAYRFARLYCNNQSVKWQFSIEDDGEYIDDASTYPPINIDGIGIIRLDKVTGIPDMHLISNDSETRYDKRAGKYVTKPIRGNEVIMRYTEAFHTLARFYYLFKDRQGLYTTKTGSKGNRVMDRIRTMYSREIPAPATEAKKGKAKK